MFATRDKGTILALFFPLFMFAAVFAACVWKMRSMSVNCVAFSLGPNSQLHLWFELPEPQAFKSFCEALAKAAEDARKNRPLNPLNFGLANEIQELQKLRESKVLSDEEFERAKAKLLSGFSGENNIGFR
jgi:hypothetical protein